MSLRHCLVALSIVLLSACAGTNFKAPEPDRLVVGQATSTDVLAVMGTPWRQSEGMRNDMEVKTLQYSYAAAMGEPLVHAVTPARVLPDGESAQWQRQTGRQRSSGTAFSSSSRPSD